MLISNEMKDWQSLEVEYRCDCFFIESFGDFYNLNNSSVKIEVISG